MFAVLAVPASSSRRPKHLCKGSTQGANRCPVSLRNETGRRVQFSRQFVVTGPGQLTDAGGDTFSKMPDVGHRATPFMATALIAPRD